MQLPQRAAVFSIFLLILFLTACAAIEAEPDVVAASEVTQALPVGPTAAAQTAQSSVATLVSRTLQAVPSATLPAPTITPTLPPTPASATAVPPRENPHYTLNVDFHYETRSGSVEEFIRYPNNTGEMLNELRLVVALYDYQGAFGLDGIWWHGGPLDGQPVDRVTREQTQQLVIALPQGLHPGETLGLRMTYTFALPAQSSFSGDRPVPLGYTGRQANLVDWYPYIPPYRSGDGWLAPPSSFYGENLVYDLADFSVNLRLLDGRKDLVVAASALPEPPEDTEGADAGLLTFERRNARNFVLSIGSDYRVATEQVGGVTVTSYYFPLHALAGERVLRTTVESLKLYEELFGPYPYASLAVVEADFLDGMEYDGLYFLSRAFYNLHQGRADDFLVAIAAHETAHMWWYGLVANDQAHEPWLDEALSTYSERLYYEHYYPAALDWWWKYRIAYDNPGGWVDTSVYGPQGATQTYLQYRSAVYLNGAVFLEDLRQLIGDEAFFAFLRDYAETYCGQIATGDDFFRLLAQHTQADLTPLLRQYFAAYQP